MILSIHQPSYFPWLGLLDKIRNSDVFMLMDEVALSDSAYQHRNTFLTSDGKTKFLTIPLVRKNYLGRPFREIEIASHDWQSNHWNFIWNNYRKHPFAKEILPYLEAYFGTAYSLLCEAVVESMRVSLALFGIETRLIFQSDMEYDRSLKRGDLVLALVRAAGADCYLSGVGAQAYLDESAFKGDIALRYNHFKHPVFQQEGVQQFQSGLSCLDVLFNLGSVGARQLLIDSGNRRGRE